MNKINVITDTVYNDKALKDIVILHMADIHFNVNTKSSKLDRLLNLVKEMKPDYVMITGDIIDIPKIVNNRDKIKELVSFIANMGSVSKVMISLGNHDILLDRDHSFFNKLDELKNIYVLDDKDYQDEFIYVSGLTLPYNYYYNIFMKESVDVLNDYLDKRLAKIDKINAPKVLLVHSPIRITNDNILKRLKDYDIILCGHMHGGMVPRIFGHSIPGNSGIVGPHMKWFPEVARGKIQKTVDGKDMTIIINEAVTKISLNASKVLSKVDFLYNDSVNKILVKKKRVMK